MYTTPCTTRLVHSPHKQVGAIQGNLRPNVSSPQHRPALRIRRPGHAAPHRGSIAEASRHRHRTRCQARFLGLRGVRRSASLDAAAGRDAPGRIGAERRVARGSGCRAQRPVRAGRCGQLPGGGVGGCVDRGVGCVDRGFGWVGEWVMSGWRGIWLEGGAGCKQIHVGIRTTFQCLVS